MAKEFDLLAQFLLHSNEIDIIVLQLMIVMQISRYDGIILTECLKDIPTGCRME